MRAMARVSGTPMPNQCCAHGAMHCTVSGAGGGMPDPSTGMMPPIDPGMAAMGMGGLYDARTPHGGIKQKVTLLHTYRREPIF